MLDAASDEERDDGHDDVQRDRDEGGGRHVVDAQQVEAGEQAAGDRASEVAAVEEAEPRHAARRRFDPARDAGSVAPISSVGGIRQMLATSARRTRLAAGPADSV